MYKIGICGAHGTGKTTLGNLIAKELAIPYLTGTMRKMWADFTIQDFEKLPADVRTQFQKHAILKQINREETEGKDGFVTDRTVLDNLGYTLLSSNLNGIDLQIYENLVLERSKNYTHLIYLPVMFEAKDEPLRADIKSRNQYAEILENYLEKYFVGKYLILSELDIEKRLKQATNYIKSV